VETQGNKLGMLDPAKGVIKEYALPSPFEVPKELAIDQSGVIWISGRKGRKLMGFDPSSKKFREFKIPSGGVIEGLVVSENKKIFYSLGRKSKLGVFDLVSKKFFEFEILLGDSHFNDIDIDKNGDIWLVDIRKSVLIMVDARAVSKIW
jgi:virginiamycin B lyase